MTFVNTRQAVSCRRVTSIAGSVSDSSVSSHLRAVLIRNQLPPASPEISEKSTKWRPSLARFLFFAPSDGGPLRICEYIDPLRVRRWLGVVVVVPVPPLVRLGLEVTLRRVLPSLLTAERCEVEIAPGRPHCLVASAVDEVCAEHLVAVAEEHVVPVPFIDAEVLIEAVCHGVPGHLPTHPRLQARDVRLRCA